MSREIFSYIKFLRALPNVTLNVPRNGASMASLGNLCPCFTIPIVREREMRPSYTAHLL